MESKGGLFQSVPRLEREQGTNGGSSPSPPFFIAFVGSGFENLIDFTWFFRSIQELSKFSKPDPTFFSGIIKVIKA